MSTKERRSRQHYSPELKLKLVKMALEASENGSSVAALAREYGINDNLLFKWIRLWQSEGLVSRPRRTYRKNASPTLLPVQITPPLQASPPVIPIAEPADMMSWLNANSRCLTFLGGVPKLLVPDNLKSAVKKADRYEPVINDSYQALAEHYGTVIIPARPYKPKDKSKAENGVLIVERWLLARIRNETFYTLRALNTRLRELLADMNNRPMKGYVSTTVKK